MQRVGCSQAELEIVMVVTALCCLYHPFALVIAVSLGVMAQAARAPALELAWAAQLVLALEAQEI